MDSIENWMVKAVLPDKDYTFSMHVFVSIRGLSPEVVEAFEPGDYEYKREKVPTSKQLMHVVKNPLTPSKEFLNVMALPPEDRPNCMGHTHIWQGSSNWTDIILYVRQ